MRLARPETQTLYAQMLEAAAAHEVELSGGFRNGLLVERQVRGRGYLYWQLRDVTARLRQVYLGPAADPDATKLAAALSASKARRVDLLPDQERLAAAYVASGGARHQGAHFKVVEALARSGLFHAGAVLVGSHAFVSIGCALGVLWSAEIAATADVDLVRDAFVSVAADALTPIDLPGVLREVDPTFFLVPELDWKDPSTSLQSRDKGVKVDLLTSAKTPRDVRPRPIGPFGLAARPMRYMDYLVRDDVTRGLYIGPHAVLVNVPHAGRFALHKLAIAERRSSDVIKSRKDRKQAAAVIEALAEAQPGALEHAVFAAKKYRDKAFLRDVIASLKHAPEAKALLRI